jgi:AcrR family transcriptional regulator
VVKTRHRTASAEIEGRILAAALRILDERGADALTVRGIATEAGIAPMGIYNRFDGKMGVYEALWVEGFDRLTATLGAVAATPDPSADLLSCGRRYRGFARENAAHYRMMFMSTVNDFTPSAPAALAGARALQRLVDLVERAQRAGQLPAGAPIDLAQSFWAAVHGFVSLELLDMIFAGDVERAFDALLVAIYHGLAGGTA